MLALPASPPAPSPFVRYVAAIAIAAWLVTLAMRALAAAQRRAVAPTASGASMMLVALVWRAGPVSMSNRSW